jgi:hypothetical protein
MTTNPNPDHSRHQYIKSQHLERQSLERKTIRRKQVQQGLLVSAMVASLALSSCGGFLDSNAPPENRTRRALFYENQRQCELDTQRQQSVYAKELAAFNNKQRAQAPIPPAFQVADCGPRMLAARREHDRHAPVYRSLEECQAEGVRCERAPRSPGIGILGYRPVFGGSYFFPPEEPRPTPVSTSSGGRSSGFSSSTSNYPPRTVYSSTTPGQVITPDGESLPRTATGLVEAPARVNTVTPSRPTGHASRGTITGRSSRGFGSSYGSSGRGGK